jgi:hypothetical protein
LATVAGFEAVGAILVVAMLVVPAAAAERLALRLHHVLGLAVLLAMTGAVVGYLAAWHFNTSAAGMMAVVLGLEYVVAILIAPQDGLLAQGMTRLGYAWRVRCEDRLAALWRAEEAGLSSAAAATDGLALRWLRVQGRVRPEAAGYRLTPQGRTEAELIVRSHRLWETWLGRHADLPVDHLHPPAEWIEHHLGARLRRQIEADLGRDARDPHGSAIPPERS